MYSVFAEVGHHIFGMKYKYCCYSSVTIPSATVLFCFLKFINNFDRSRSCLLLCLSLSPVLELAFLFVVMVVIHIQVGMRAWIQYSASLQYVWIPYVGHKQTLK